MTYTDLKETAQRLLNTNFDRAFGLDISDSSIELIELNKIIHFAVQTYGRIEIPAGIVKEGKILDEALLGEQVKTLLKQVKPSRVSTNKVILSLPDMQVLTHALILKGPQPKDMRTAIGEEVAKILPLQPALLYWDFKTKPLPGGSTFVTFAGISRAVADSYVRVCNTIGLRVVSFSLQPLSIARGTIRPGDHQTLILDIGTTYTNASVINGNDELDLSMYIPYGGEHMTVAVMKDLSLTKEEAEKAKIDSSFDKNDTKVAPLLVPVLDSILAEATKVVSYYEKTFSLSIDGVLLVGGSSLLPGIHEHVSTVLKKPAVTLSNFSELRGIAASALLQGGRNMALFAPVVGLGMLGSSNEFRDLNLITQMPRTVLDEVKTVELFRGGYVSKARAVRIFFNNRITLGVMFLIILGVAYVFAVQLSEYRLKKGLDALNAQPKATLIREDVSVNSGIATSTSTTTPAGGVSTSSLIIKKK